MTSEYQTREPLKSEVEALRRQLSEAEEALRNLERRNRLLGDSAPFGILAADTKGRITGSNRKIQEMIPWPTGQDPASVKLFEIKSLAEAGVVDEFQQCIKMKAPIVSQHACVAQHDGKCHLKFFFSPVVDEIGAVREVLLFLEDITHQITAEEMVRESGERYRLLFQYSPIALIERDASRLKSYLEQLRGSGIADFSDYLQKNPHEATHCMGMIQTVAFNDAFLRLLEADHPDQLKTDLYPKDAGEFLRMAHEVLLMIAAGDISHERERVLFTVKGNRKNVLIKALIVTGHEDTFARIVISLVDISERKRAEEALRISEQKFREQALRDNLTGLYNRRYLYKSLSELIGTCKAEGAPLSLVFMDLDNFKQVVDAHGHLNGSRAIQEVAATIRNSISEPSYAVAYAGDEFVIVLPGSNPSQAVETADFIRAAMSHALYLHDQGLDVKLRASFGIGAFPDHAEDVTELLAAADRALFAIKGKGKNAIGLAATSC